MLTRIDRLPLNIARRTVGMGLIVGLSMKAVEWSRGRLADRAPAEHLAAESIESSSADSIR